MPDEPTVPEFTLPDWGTEGAPPAPDVPIDEAPEAQSEEIEITVETSILLLAGPLPDRWQVHTVHGIVTSHGRGDKDDHVDAVESATSKALAGLEDRALAIGANAVTDVSLTVSGRKAKVVVTTWGTAVSFSR
jgi:hypothetical protein